jgi:hypothetical protein
VKCREKRACKPGEEMSMQGIHEEELILSDTLIEGGVVDVSGE